MRIITAVGLCLLALAYVGGAMLLQVLVVVAYRRIRPGPEDN